jgi:hypothetical protein
LIGEMTIDRSATCVMAQQCLGRFLSHLLRGPATRSQGAEPRSGMLVFRDQEYAGARTGGMHVFGAYIDVCSEERRASKRAPPCAAVYG